MNEGGYTIDDVLAMRQGSFLREVKLRRAWSKLGRAEAFWMDHEQAKVEAVMELSELIFGGSA